MKILTAEQRKDADKYTIANGTAPETLMERAAKAVSEYIFSEFERSTTVHVYAGQGNNGADGLAVARLIKRRGYDPKVYVIQHKKEPTDLFEMQLERVRALQTVPVYELSESSTLPDHDEEIVIVDALLGSGIKGEVADESLLAKVITHINTHEGHTVAIDVPSGMLLDEPTNGVSVAANHVITFERPALAFLIEDNADFAQEFQIARIGLNHDYMEDMPGNLLYTDHAVARKLLQLYPRKKFSSKDDYGNCYLVTGSSKTMGAAVLASRAALLSGSGSVTVHVPASGRDLLLQAAPELLVETDHNQDMLTETAYTPERFDVTGIGPGIGTHHQTVEMLEDILARSELDSKLVLDADALNILAANPEMLDMLPPQTLLTPHQKEFERLAGPWRDSFELLDTIQGFVATHNISVIVKGHYSIVALPGGQLHFNSSGNAGMATAGTGDVLLGVVTSLISQGWSVEEAAILGCYVHGKAGDIAAEELGMLSMTASDVISLLPKAFQDLS